MSRSRWIWIVLVNGKPCRFFAKHGFHPGYSYASSFFSRTEVDAAVRRQKKEYVRLRDQCLAGGSPKGVESWTKCLETIRVHRIELSKEVR